MIAAFEAIKEFYKKNKDTIHIALGVLAVIGCAAFIVLFIAFPYIIGPAAAGAAAAPHVATAVAVGAKALASVASSIAAHIGSVVAAHAGGGAVASTGLPFILAGIGSVLAILGFSWFLSRCYRQPGATIPIAGGFGVTIPDTSSTALYVENGVTSVATLEEQVATQPPTPQVPASDSANPLAGTILNRSAATPQGAASASTLTFRAGSKGLVS